MLAEKYASASYITSLLIMHSEALVYMLRYLNLETSC